MRAIALLGGLALALPLIAAAAPVREHAVGSARKEVVPFLTVGAGGSSNHPRRNRLYLARTRSATSSWDPWLDPITRAALAKIDFHRYGVLAVFSLQQSTGLEITRLVLASQRLVLWLAVSPPPPPSPDIVTLGDYHLVAIERKYLGSVSHLVVMAETVRS